MLRHLPCFTLANKGVDDRAIQDYIRHKNIQHTTKYIKLAEPRLSESEKLL
jgi:site-specific recombinase XerD